MSEEMTDSEIIIGRDGAPLQWKRPDEVMKMHRLKKRKQALQARMNRTAVENNGSLLNQNNSNTTAVLDTRLSQKRKNPFAKNNDLNKKPKELTPVELDGSSDTTLFQLLRMEPSNRVPNLIKPPNLLSFASVLTKLESTEYVPAPEPLPRGEKYIPIDWTLKTKMRFMSSKPFAWNGKLKTSEEASGTTGYVRCLDIGEEESTLDTSPNARFHQRCLVWQHPSLPWLELFPRSAGRLSATNTNHITSIQSVKDALYREWCQSFRSLFHLLRARQCAYFYVCANNFTVLFRAAGVCGIPEIHALMTPTTRGLRQMLKQEEIEYTMPLRKDRKRRSGTTDSGCASLDSSSSTSLVDEPVDDDDDEEDGDKWLQSLGVDDSEIRRINFSQTRLNLDKESEMDNLKQSLVFVTGVEAQALFNFLINCKSAIPVTGALAGVPPTLLAPVAFHGATLRPLKVRENILRDGKDKYYSLEVTGPLLPHVLPSLCHLIKSSQMEEFSVGCAQLPSTSSFSAAKHGPNLSESKEGDILPQSVFGQESLTDCGFSKDLLDHFCSPDPEHIQVVENLKFSNELFTWT